MALLHKEDQVKSKNSKSHLNMEGINAEFKHLRLRIKRLEDLLLKQETNLGSISEKVEKLNKG